MNEGSSRNPSIPETVKLSPHDMRMAEGKEASRDFEKIQASKNWSSDDWKEHQRLLKKEPYLAAEHEVFASIDLSFFEIERKDELERMSERSPDAPIASVETRLIVRAPTFKDWGDSYHQTHHLETLERGENAVIEIARTISVRVNEILDDPNIPPEEKQSQINDALERANIFGASGIPVCLKSHEGPRGPVYFAQDGSHRIAAAKLVGLDHVAARVGSAQDKTTARKVWYESLVLMSEKAQRDLRAIYDQVYPPTVQEKLVDNIAYAEARSRIASIQQELNLINQKLDQESQMRYEKIKDTESQFVIARKIADQLKEKKRFNRLHREAGLRFLKEFAPDSLWKEYEQEIDEQGYLVRKDGRTGYISSIGYDIGDSEKRILIDAVETYRNEFPNEFGPDLENKDI